MTFYRGVKYVPSQFVKRNRVVFYQGTQVTHSGKLGDDAPMHIEFDTIAHHPEQGAQVVLATALIARVRRVCRSLSGLPI